MAVVEYSRVEQESSSNEYVNTLFFLTNCKKFTFSLLFIGLALLTFILIVLLIVRTSEKNPDTKYVSKYCQTKACLKSGMDIISRIDESVDPCEDFYNFTCGGFLKHTYFDVYVDLRKIIKNKLRRYFDNIDSAFIPDAVETASKFYQSCLKNSDILHDVRMKRIEFEIKRFKVLLSNSSTLDVKINDWQKMNTIGINNYADVCMICISVVQNAFNSSKKIIMIKNTDIDHFTLLIDLRMFGGIFRFIDRQKILYFYEMLKPIKPKSVADALTNEDNYMTIRRLSEEIPSVDWLEMIVATIEKDASHPIFGINEDEVIFVNDLPYMKSFIAMVENNTFNQSLIETYFDWKIAAKVYHPGLIESLKMISPHLSLSERTIKDFCLNYVNYFFNYVIDYIYDIEDNSKHKSFQKLLDLSSHLKHSFYTRAKTSDWLDAQAQKFIELKLEGMELILDISPWATDINQVNAFYSEIHLTDDFFDNYFIIMKHFRRFFLDNFREEISQKELFHGLSRLLFGAYYFPSNNAIVLPINMQGLPLYNENRPGYLNFGSIGFILSHEMNHAFGIQGLKRDEKGHIRTSSSKSISDTLLQKMECFIQQNSNYKLEKNFKDFDGSKKINENVADSEGLRQAFEAYKQWKEINKKEKVLFGLEKYSPEQLFFISFGTTLCIRIEYDKSYDDLQGPSNSAYRVNSAVSNLEQFSEAFNCKPNSAMNPEQKCKIW